MCLHTCASCFQSQFSINSSSPPSISTILPLICPAYMRQSFWSVHRKKSKNIKVHYNLIHFQITKMPSTLTHWHCLLLCAASPQEQFLHQWPNQKHQPLFQFYSTKTVHWLLMTLLVHCSKDNQFHHSWHLSMTCPCMKKEIYDNKKEQDIRFLKIATPEGKGWLKSQDVHLIYRDSQYVTSLGLAMHGTIIHPSHINLYGSFQKQWGYSLGFVPMNWCYDILACKDENS